MRVTLDFDKETLKWASQMALNNDITRKIYLERIINNYKRGIEVTEEAYNIKRPEGFSRNNTGIAPQILDVTLTSKEEKEIVLIQKLKV
jgi:hypothetical protein